MVILKDLFHLLATGEFANIALSRTNTGGLDEKEYEKVIGHINLGILEIYKRFKLLENEFFLHADPSVTTYYLREANSALLNNITTTEYIEIPDNVEGFLNIVEITSIFDSEGEELRMNNRFEIPTIQQLSSDILKITQLEAAGIFSVVYQSYPDKIVIEDDFDPSAYVVYIPETIIEPLMYYVASRVYKPMGSNDSTANADKSDSYQQQYELSCMKLDLFGLPIQEDDKENTFESQGWT